jgi:hypothetical protein
VSFYLFSRSDAISGHSVSPTLAVANLRRMKVVAHFGDLFFLLSSQSNKITSTSEDSERRSCFAAFSIAAFVSGSTRAPSGIFAMPTSIPY